MSSIIIAVQRAGRSVLRVDGSWAAERYRVPEELAEQVAAGELDPYAPADEILS